MPSATLPKVSSSGRRSHTSGVVVRGPCHRVAREESGSNPHARVLCPSVATASCLIPRPASCSWWHAFRRAERHGSGSPPPEQVFIHRAEDLIGEFEGPDILAC